MLAAVLHSTCDLRLESVPRPIPKPGEVLLRVRRAGVCGSDVHYFRHGHCGPFVPSSPFILGHEFVAVVAQLGVGPESLHIGERVVVNPALSCGQCESCMSGRRNLCPHVKMLGSASSTPPTDGAIAEFVAVNACQCHSVSDAVTDLLATLVEPLTVALHAIRRAGGVAGARVLVTGGGPIGTLTALTAIAYGASLVVLSEPSPHRRGIALNCGIECVLDPLDESYSQNALLASDGGFDAVFEASGAPEAVRQSIEVVRCGGRIVQIGTVHGNHVTLRMNEIMTREISLLGTFRYADEFSEAIRLIESGRVPFERIVTETFPLSDLASAMAFASDGSESLKVHIALDNEGQ